MKRALFLSYASQDGEAARRICEALRAGGIEVWFDQSELRGGDAWDQHIRNQIRESALFLAVISASTNQRDEGYFRREWKLAVDRTDDMAHDKPFLLPVVIDGTSDTAARVPEKFRQLQWTHLPNGETPPAFVEQVARLLLPDKIISPAVGRAAPPALAPPLSAASNRRSRHVAMLAALAIVLLGVAYIAVDKFVLSKHVTASVANVSEPSAIPEQSIAVLPFADMSEKKDQDYFSDGLTEEMIGLLSQVPELRVPARTSSFYFKGKKETIANIAQQLKVAHVLEGSVRKAGQRLRITAQLIRADSGYNLWSQTYDREDKDIFAVQDDIARSVVTALKVTLAATLQLTGARGTGNDEAYNQYLLGRQLDRQGSLEGNRLAVEAYQKAIELDPNYAAAYAGRAIAKVYLADLTGDRGGGLESAGHDVEKAIALAPNDPSGYLARGYIRQNWLWDWFGAQQDIEKALILDPRNSNAHFQYAILLESLGRLPEASVAQKEATELDALSSQAWRYLARLYTEVGDYVSADTALSRAIELEPTSVFGLTILGRLRLAQGRAQEALDAFRKLDNVVFRLVGVAMVEHTLGHVKRSQQALDQVIANYRDAATYQIAEVYAWRGEKDKAFEWLERAYQQQDGGLSRIKGDALLTSLRDDPRFNALLRKMNLPE